MTHLQLSKAVHNNGTLRVLPRDDAELSTGAQALERRADATSQFFKLTVQVDAECLERHFGRVHGLSMPGAQVNTNQPTQARDAGLLQMRVNAAKPRARTQVHGAHIGARSLAHAHSNNNNKTHRKTKPHTHCSHNRTWYSTPLAAATNAANSRVRRGKPPGQPKPSRAIRTTSAMRAAARRFSPPYLARGVAQRKQAQEGQQLRRNGSCAHTETGNRTKRQHTHGPTHNYTHSTRMFSKCSRVQSLR